MIHVRSSVEVFQRALIHGRVLASTLNGAAFQTDPDDECRMINAPVMLIFFIINLI